MNSVRIGNGCGFWGDQLDAPILLVQNGKLDYLTLEYLAELTMSILAAQKKKDPQTGYARDFVDVLERLVPELRSQPHLKIVTNAGGMNPFACAQAAQQVLAKAGLSKRIAYIQGDDLLPNIDSLLANGNSLAHLDSGTPLQSIRERVVSANAYLGAGPIVTALAQNAEIIITGRVADASLTVGPAIHELGWSLNHPDQVAAASVAGHLIECGAQVTGGLWNSWEQIPDFANIGYPIAEIDRDGRFRISKPENSGGIINRETVIEQLLYEVSDPAAYLTPDGIVDFTSVRLETKQKNVVEVQDSKGKPATDSYKVSIAYQDGFTASGMLTIFGPNTIHKAKTAGEMILKRLARIGHTYNHSYIEWIGAGACVPGVVGSSDPPEVMLRVSVRDPNKKAVERFTKEFAPLVTSGPPGVTGYTTGRPTVREVYAYWPSLIAKSTVDPQVAVKFIDS